MSANERDSEILAEWALGRFARYASDAQNVVEEALAEEREARILSRESGGGLRPPRPTLSDLLATAQFLAELTQLSLADTPPDSPKAAFLSNILDQAKTICTELSDEIHGRPPTASDHARGTSSKK